MKGLLNLLDKRSGERDDILIEKLGSKYKSLISKLGIISVCIVVIAICPLLLRYLYVQKEKVPPDFNLISIQKKEVKELEILDNPIITAQTVQNWTAKALSNSFSFDFYHMNQTFVNSQKYFTKEGWEAFYGALDKSEILKNVADKQLVVWLTLLQDPYVLSSHRIGNYVVWDVEAVALITYVGASAPTTQRVYVNVKILQVPTTESPYGIQISKIDMI